MMLAAVLMMASPMALGLQACATSQEPFEYQSDNETKPGRGVFTGEKGTWTIYRTSTPSKPQPASTPDSGEAAGTEAQGRSPAADAAARE